MSTNQIPETGAGQPPAPDYENKRQLAARLGVSIRTIDNLLTRGLPHCKLTRKLIRFPRAAVDEWLNTTVNCGTTLPILKLEMEKTPACA